MLPWPCEAVAHIDQSSSFTAVVPAIRTGTHMSLILQWLQLVLKLRQSQSAKEDPRHIYAVRRERLSQRDKNNLFIAAHRRFIL
jgi:hypothetical protein